MAAAVIIRKCLITGIAWIMLLVLCVSAAFAEDSAADAAENLAGYGLSQEDILVDYFGFLPEERGFRLSDSQENRPLWLWFDITGDGCVDLCAGRMFGSGMVRTQMAVYDPLSRKQYVLDGYNYDFIIDSISEGRLIVVKSGPNGYGDPVAEVRGTVILENGMLVFVGDPEPDASVSDDLFDPSQAAVSADQAVLAASAFAREYLGAEYCNEISVSHMGFGDSGESVRYCWLISFYRYGKQEYIVYVNTETGEVENSFTMDEGIG